MNIRLRYRQGALLREEPRYSEGDAIVRAGELIENDDGCADFEITNEHGDLLKSDHDIRRAYRSLWDNELEITPPAG
jgi:hypothetical protein